MEYKEGASILTADGKQVGHLDRVVIDPKTKEVTHIVVHKGFIFTEDKVVPVNLIASAKEDRITLREDAGDLAALPKFEERHFVPLDKEESTRIGYEAFNVSPLYSYYPPYGVAYPYQRVEIEQHIPEGTVALKEGAEVISADGEHVGDVEEILTDPQADRVTHFVITQGLFFKDRKLVPITWVSRFGEEQVHLEVGSRLLDGLPEYRD